MPSFLLCQDLFFWSKITSVANELGRGMKVLPAAAKILDAIDESTDLVIIDLSCSPASEELRALREKLPPTARLIAFGSHIDVDRLQQARQAGCDPVMPKSQFVEELVGILGTKS